MLSLSLKVKDFFIVSGKSGNPRPEQCAELVGYIGDQHCSLNWKLLQTFLLKIDKRLKNY